MLRPLGGTEDEACGIDLPLEAVEPAPFDLPDLTAVGGYGSRNFYGNSSNQSCIFATMCSMPIFS